MTISISSGTLRPREQPEVVTRVRTVERGLFAMSFAMFVAVFLAWIGVQAFTTQIRAETEALVKRQAELRGQRLAERDTQLLATVARTQNIADVLRRHQDGRAALTFLEERVQPGVVFSSPSVDYANSSIGVTAIAANTSALAQQMAFFEEAQNVRRVVTDGTQRNTETGEVFAVFTITLSREAFLVKSAP